MRERSLRIHCSPGPAGHGFALALLLATSSTAILGFACAGLDIANTAPVLFGAVGRLPDTDPGAGIAATAGIGCLGFLAGPPLIGLLAELTSLATALGLLVLACGPVALRAPLVRVAGNPVLPHKAVGASAR